VRKVKFIAPARREFLKEVGYYNGKQLGLGARFAEEVEAATARALAYPDAGSPASRSTKRVLVNHFPFSIIYRPSQDGIVVFAVANYSRLPEYWISRI
jgi:toxin ParE1/3/4